MGFFERLKSAIRKIKNKLIVYAVLVVFIIIILIAPMTASIKGAEIAAGVKFSQNPFSGPLWQVLFANVFGNEVGIVNPFGAIKRCLQEQYIEMFFERNKRHFNDSSFICTSRNSKSISKT